MSDLSASESQALTALLREALGQSDLSLSQGGADEQKWDSHQTLHIIFGAEEIFGVQFGSAQMERIDGVAALLTEIRAARAGSA